MGRGDDEPSEPGAFALLDRRECPGCLLPRLDGRRDVTCAPVRIREGEQRPRCAGGVSGALEEWDRPLERRESIRWPPQRVRDRRAEAERSSDVARVDAPFA